MNIKVHYENLRAAYRRIFRSAEKRTPDLAMLMDDLREFCYLDRSCVQVGKDGHIDVQATFVAEGRREVWLKINQTLMLTDEDLIRLGELTKVRGNENE